MENGNKTKKSEYFEDGSEENSGETLNKEKSKLKFYLNLSSVIILGLLLLICGLSLFIPLDIPSWSLREDGFLISIFQFGPSTDYFVCNVILILIPFILIIVELSSFLKYRKKSFMSSIFFIGMAIAVLKMDSDLDYLGGTFVALLIFGIVLSFGNIGINVFSIIKYSEKKITKRNIVYFAISLASLAVSASIFFIDFNIINEISTFAVSTSFSEALSDTKRYLIFSNDNFYLIYVGLLFSLLVILAAALFAKGFESLITDSEECDSNVKKPAY